MYLSRFFIVARIENKARLLIKEEENLSSAAPARNFEMGFPNIRTIDSNRYGSVDRMIFIIPVSIVEYKTALPHRRYYRSLPRLCLSPSPDDLMEPAYVRLNL